MVTVALYWIAASYLVGIGLVLDQLRRTPSEWQAAGRDRRFWVALSLILGFHGLGQYALAGYLGGVVPRLHRAPRGRDARSSASAPPSCAAGTRPPASTGVAVWARRSSLR